MKFSFVVFVLVFLAFSCGTTKNSSIVRQAENLPDKFEPNQGVTLNGNSCKSPMIDRRDGTELLMVSSMGGIGDYRVHSNKYGLNKGELLRIDCKTGKPIGIVKE